jgi:hypothetical protein
VNGAGGGERRLFALFSGSPGADDFRSHCEAGPGGGGEWGVRRAARGAVRRLSVIRANDSGRALGGTMPGAAGFCRPQWLIGLPAGCAGAASGGGGGEGRRGHCPRPGRGAEARPCVARPPPKPGARTGRQRRGGPPHWRPAGGVGAWVPLGPNFVPKEKPGRG